MRGKHVYKYADRPKDMNQHGMRYNRYHAALHVNMSIEVSC